MTAFNLIQIAHNQNPYFNNTIAPYFDRDKYDLNAPFEVLHIQIMVINTIWTDGNYMW